MKLQYLFWNDKLYRSKKDRYCNIVPKKIDTVTSFMDDLSRSKKKIDTVTSFMDDLEDHP